MVLLVNGVILDEVPPDSRCFYHNFPHFKDGASQLCAVPTKTIGSVGLLFVDQREFAVTVPEDKHLSILGTDDFTTCLVVIIRNSASGAIGLTHLDGAGIDTGLIALIQRIQELSIGYPEGRLQLHIIGGFADPHGYSDELFYNVLQIFHKHPADLDLILVCVGELNSTLRGGINWPIIYGTGVHLKTGEIFPATFPDKGPDIPLRQARLFSETQHTQMMDIYDCSHALLQIGPFNYKPLRGVNLWLQQPDQVILQHLSTSPEVEPPHFANQVRAALKHIQDHPFPAITIFPDNRPRYYRKDESGLWLPIRF